MKERSLEWRINYMKSLTGREPIFSPFLPGNVFVNFRESHQRWYCRIGISQPHALAVYRHFKGEPPEGFHVHHINGNSILLENDNPDNLIAVPSVWNRTYFPLLSKEFELPESQITKTYMKLVDLVTERDLFREVCHDLYSLTTK